FILSDLGKILALGALGLLFFYPYTKRFFVFPQLILGFAFNTGILIAVAEIKPELLYTPQPWLLYGIGIFWTLYYDTIYATQDIKDDLVLGVHSTAVFFKNHLKVSLASFYIGMIILMATLGLYLKGDIWFYITLIFAVIYDIGVEIRRFNLNHLNVHSKSASRLFINALLMGIGILFLILFPD
ncbi:MAG: UbiA family prenyltransferase, partial [Alphaproteobacteria bacterium]|nr:UbiA family prenyltransferase [Alphaproteobacteria bacterium]